MNTGYSITDDRIYGPRGYAECWIEGDGIYSSGGGYTGFEIIEGRVYHRGKDTGYRIEDGRIHGPSGRLLRMSNRFLDSAG